MHARVAPCWEIWVATPSAEPESCWGHADVLGKGGGIHPRLQPRASSGSEKELDQKGDSEFPHPCCTLFLHRARSRAARKPRADFVGFLVQASVCTVAFSSLFPLGAKVWCPAEGSVTAQGRVRTQGARLGALPGHWCFGGCRAVHRSPPHPPAPQDPTPRAMGQTLPPHQAAQPQPFGLQRAGSDLLTNTLYSTPSTRH